MGIQFNGGVIVMKSGFAIRFIGGQAGNVVVDLDEIKKKYFGLNIKIVQILIILLIG